MESSPENIRKRVCRACERCRLKKAKCDGAKPCYRCRTDDAICVFGERKKLQDRVHPKGYVEILEQQHIQLVLALRVLYFKLVNGQPWPGEHLRLDAQDGQHPLTHSILERLNLLHLPDNSGVNSGWTSGDFTENTSKIERQLWEQDAPTMDSTNRRSSPSGPRPPLEDKDVWSGPPPSDAPGSRRTNEQVNSLSDTKRPPSTLATDPVIPALNNAPVTPPANHEWSQSSLMPPVLVIPGFIPDEGELLPQGPMEDSMDSTQQTPFESHSNTIGYYDNTHAFIDLGTSPGYTHDPTGVLDGTHTYFDGWPALWPEVISPSVL